MRIFGKFESIFLILSDLVDCREPLKDPFPLAGKKLTDEDKAKSIV